MTYLGLGRTRVEVLGVWGAGVGLGLILGVASSVGRTWTAAVAVVAVLLVGAYYTKVLGREAGLVLLLIVTSVIDHFTFSVGPLALRAEQVAAFIAVGVVVVTRLRERETSWLKPSLPEAMLLAWFVVGAVSSLLGSPDRRLSAKILALVVICSLGFFLPRRLMSGPRAAEQFEVVVRWLLVVFVTESVYGSFTYLLHVFGPTISIGPNPASGHLESFGTLWEQNVFGAFAAAGAIAWVYLGPGRFPRPWLGLAACVGGLFDSLTRAAWLVAAIVGGLGALVPKLRHSIDWRMVGVGGLAALPVIVGTILVDRIGTYVVPASTGGAHGSSNLLAALLNVVDLIGRLNQTSPVFSDISGRVVLGRGIASFEALHVAKGVPEHIASLPLLVLNDTGVIGLALFAGFVAAVFARAWSRRRNLIVMGLGQVAIVVALTNIATETTELMVGWLLVGLLIAACDVVATTATEGKSNL